MAGHAIDLPFFTSICLIQVVDSLDWHEFPDFSSNSSTTSELPGYFFKAFCRGKKISFSVLTIPKHRQGVTGWRQGRN